MLVSQSEPVVPVVAILPFGEKLKLAGIAFLATVLGNVLGYWFAHGHLFAIK